MTDSPTQPPPRPARIGAPRFGAAQIRLLERLCNACAVSGDETEVRRIVLEQVKPYASEVRVDALGNLLAYCPAAGAPHLRVLVAAHMDEVGLMLTGDEGDGFFRFTAIGGVDVRCLPGKSLQVGREHLPALIGLNPFHLASDHEVRSVPSIDDLRIDVGPDNAKKVKVGDWAAFTTPFARLGPSLRAKALDDRIGVATLIELVHNPPPHLDLVAAFTVQEEVGLRGASVAAYSAQPDLAFVLDCTPARDLPAWDSGSPGDQPSQNARYNTRLGAGPAIYIADADSMADPRLVRHLIETAEALGLPYQLRQPGGDGTDAGAIHLQRAGIPSVSLAVPGRYLHTPAGIVRLSDWKNTLALIQAALLRLTPDILTLER